MQRKLQSVTHRATHKTTHKTTKKTIQKTRWISLASLCLLFAVPFISGCDKVANSAKNLQSDWMGLERNVELYSCMTGKLLKVYQGDVRINPEDTQGTSLLINGKKVNTNLCFIITEVGIKEELIPGRDLNALK